MAQHKTIDRRKAATDAQSVARRLAEQKRAQPTAPAARTAATPATGGYHSPREYGGQRDFYEARVTQTRTAMEQQQAAFREAQKALEASRRQADEQQKRYESLKDKFRGETAEQYRKQLMDQWTSAVQEYKTAQGAYDNAWTAYQPYEDAYNAAVGEYNTYMAGERAAYDGWKASIRGADEIREEQKGIKEKRAELQRRMQMANDIAAGTAAPGIMAQAAQNEAAIRALQEYLGGAGDREKLLQEELDWSEHFRFEDLRKNGDFGEKSRFTGVDNQGDRVYQYVNGNPNAVSGSIDALLDSSTQDDLLLRMTGGNDGWRDIIGYNETPTYLEHMTEDEKAMYNYVYSTEGREAAQGYLDHLKPELTARKTGTVTKFWRMLAGQNAVTGALYSGLSVPMNAAGGIQAGLGQVASALRGEELDPNASYNLMAHTKNAIRDEVSGKIQEHAGPVGSFAYGTVMSMADMAMDAAVGNPAAATALIGTRAFSEQVIDSKNRGLSDEQALHMGIISAFAELVTEKLGLDELLHLPDKWATGGFWKGAARGAGGEALEEGLTNLMNLAADISIAGDESEFAQSVERYKAEGLSEEKAVWKALGDAGISLALDAAGGAISGGVFGGWKGHQGKKAEGAKEKTEVGKAPSVSEADSSPIPDGTGEPLGDGTQAVPYEETAVTAQNGESDVQKTDGRQEEPDAHLPGPEDFVGREGEYPGGAEAWLKDAREDGLVVDADENGGKVNEGEHLLSGGPERHDAPGAGEPVERYEVRRERQQAEARSQAERADQRRIKAQNLERLGKAQRLSPQDMGLKQGTEAKDLLELPRYEWDEELWEPLSRIEKETGYKVRAVTGNIGIRLKGGGTGLVRGYIDRVSGTIVINVAHTQVAAGQIADHELWHWKMDAMGRVSGDRYEMTRAAVQRIREEYDPDEFDAVLDKYINEYCDVYDTNAPDFVERLCEEIMADAYAGINVFGPDVAKYRSTVDAVMAENGVGRNVWNAQEQEDYAAPGGDGRVYTDEDAPPPRDEDFSQEMPEYEDYSQVPESKHDPEDDWQIMFSMENGDVRFSMDSEGRELTAEQQEFFRDSKVRDEQGRLMVMYHGTPNGSHTKFRSGTYFTPMREYADKYQNPNASMLSTKRNADAPKTYEVYLNITKPFDTRNPQERKIFEEEYYRKWGTGAPLADSGLPDWTDGMDLQEFIEEMEYDYDGLILDEGATGGYGMEVKSRGLSYVTFSPEQVKNVDNAEPTDDEDIRFSMESAVEETKELVAVHNLSRASLNWALDMGGFPSPSIAIKNRTTRHGGFGPITVVFRKDTVDPEKDGNRVYSGDAWTSMRPGREMGMWYPIDIEKAKEFVARVDDLVRSENWPTGLGWFGIDDRLDEDVYRTAIRLSNEPKVRKAFLNDRYAKTQTKMSEPLNEGDLIAWIENGIKDAFGKPRIVPKVMVDFGGAPAYADGPERDVTLEDISKEMRLSDEYEDFSSLAEKSIYRALVEDFGSLNEIRRNAWRLTDGEEDGSAEIVVEASAIAFELSEKMGMGDERAFELVLDAIDPKRENEYNYVRENASAEIIEKLEALKNKIRKKPTPYFEAKPDRAVGLDEVAAVVVPTDLDGKTVRKARDKGLVVLKYAAGNEQSRLEKINLLHDVRFSMEDSLSREEYERLAAEVAGDQSKRNEEFVKSKLTPEQYKQYKAFAREDRLDQEAEARVRGIERFEEAQAREDMAALRAQQAEDAAAGRRELAAEEKAAKAEAREKAGTARAERRRKAQEKREKLRQEAKERIRQAAENAPADSAPTIARKELQDKLISLFSVGEGQRGELRREIGQLADRMIAERTVDERDLRRLIDRLYESGVMVIEPEEVYAEGRSYLKDEHIYISPEQIRELGDDWAVLRKKAWGLGVYLTTDRSYAGLDVWNADMASYLPGLFNENETDSRTILDRLLHIAEEGKAEKVSLPEYTKRIAKQEHQSEEALLYNMERQVEEALRTFGEKASLEMRLKNRNARRRAMDREEAAIARENERTERERLRQDLKDERAYLKERNEAERDRLRLERAENDRRNAAERRRLAEERAARRRKHQEAVRKKELRELQEKTLKALQWISKNRRKAPEAMQEAFDAVLGNIDLYAISMADEMNWSSKYGATWKDLKQMYLHAQETDPNFMPSEDLQRIVDRLDSVQLESMDFDQLRDLYQAAVGLRTEFHQRNNVIGSEEHQIMEELYSACVEEMRTAPKKLKGMLDRFLNLEQMTPMNVFEEMGGFNPDGALYKFAKQLEDGERKVRSFKVRSNKILADFLEDNADWIHKADGQGKDGIWIEVEIPQLIGMKVGEVPEFGGTVKVFMTPMQRVHLYLESRNYDNLRHMTGGRTFADRELYSQGKREEAFAKGTTIRMAPETVQMLVKDMSPEEMELARLLDKYYNDLAATEINKVSNILLGYNKAMGGHYAPIFTDKNYTESEFGRYDCTAEGAGNLKERNHYSKVPSYNISALDAFERNMDRTATYVGMAIPSRNWATLMKRKAGDSSFKAEIDHTWGPERKKYIETLITDLQNPMGEQQDMVTEMSGKLLSNYISSVFGFNLSIVVKQLGSIPMASAYLDWKYFPKKVIGKGKIDRELIGRYTPDLDWRTRGYSMPETKQLKDAPNWSQKNKVVGLVFGGDAITAMDGLAASVLWPWAENKVRAEFPGLEVGDAAMIESGQSPFYQKVAELFNDAVSRSQSVSDQMHQGRLRKSKHAAAKAVTMFRSDSAQSYNVLRQRLGELDYYRRQGEGGKEMAEAAKKAVGAAATAVLINSIWGTTWDLLVKALKGKLDEEDKEPIQIVEDFFWGVIDSYAGMVTVGDIVAETVGNWFTGEMRFDQEAPGVEQFNDILQAADKIVNAGKKGNLIGAIKIGAETVASYGFGLPTKNVEAYLMGLFSWALPGAKVAYEDLLKAPAKEDLKGLEGKALTVRLNHVLKGYGVELKPEVREALAALYEAGYTEAVPSAAPDAVTVDGVELELDGRMKKEYDKTRGGIIEQELPEITGSAFFTQADEKTRKAMVTKLYNYAAEKAKKAVLEDYPIGTTAQAIDEIVRSGGSAADYAVFDAVTADMAAWQRAEVLQEWGADEAVTGLMFKHLVSKSWEDEQAKLRRVGVDVGQFLELYAMHGQIDTQNLDATAKATNYAYWLDGQRYTEAQKTVIKDQMAYFQMMPADASRYNTATAAGLDRDQASELTEALNELEPPEGKTSIQQIQKWRVGIDNAWAPENQLQQLKAVGMDDAAYAKCEALWDVGVAPAAYVRAKELASQFNEDGEGTLKNEEWTKLINSLVPSGIALPGDNERFNMTNEQMGFLWQMLTGSESTKNNPFSAAGGEKWLAIKNKDK